MLYRDKLNNLKRECPVCLHYHEVSWRFCDNCGHEYSKKERLDLRDIDKWKCPRLKRVNRYLRQKDATSHWLTKEQWDQIQSIYRSRGQGDEVDHIVPIKGKGVCGLHVPWNLQPLRKDLNTAKGNRWWPDMWEVDNKRKKK